MDPIRGAGQQFRAQVASGNVYFIAQEFAFRYAPANQDYFLTDQGRIMRLDRNVGQYYAYDARQRDFIPSPLNAGEHAQAVENETELFNLILAQQGWGDYFAGKAVNFASAAGKQAVFGATAGLTAAVIGPVVVKGANHLADALAKPAAHVAHVATDTAHKAANSHVAHAALNAKANVAAHLPNVPHVMPDFFPGPHRPFCPFPIPGNECPPPWWRGPMLFGAGGTTVGSTIGFFLGGPLGAGIGGVVGAGFGGMAG